MSGYRFFFSLKKSRVIKKLTNIYFLGPIWRDLVIYILVSKEVEAAKGVKEKVSKVLIHVDSQDPAVKAIYASSTIHHL